MLDNILLIKKFEARARIQHGGQNIGFFESADNALLIEHDLSRWLSRNIQILMMRESEVPFRILTRVRYKAEQMIEIDINAAHEAGKEKGHFKQCMYSFGT